MQNFKVKELPNNTKVFASKDINYIFKRDTGFTMTWGETLESNPIANPHGPIIADIEISTICHKACSFCYKSNTAKGTYMTIDTFRQVFDKFPKTLTQIAFGIGDVNSNPDLIHILKYCRYNGVVPNITINGERLSDDMVQLLATHCGAVAVSCYDFETCFNAIDKLSIAGLKQKNIHMLLSENTYPTCVDLVNKAKTDPRLRDLGAIVFLWLKPKGDRNTYKQLSSREKHRELINLAMEKGVSIGFDSCSANRFLESIKDHPKYAQFEPMVEPCESGLMSIYIDVNGVAYPCSFCEGNDQFKGVSVLEAKDFVQDVWLSDEMQGFLKRSLASCRECCVYDLRFK